MALCDAFAPKLFSGETNFVGTFCYPRITVDPEIFGGKPVIQEWPWLKPEDIQACLFYACRIAGYERIEPQMES